MFWRRLTLLGALAAACSPGDPGSEVAFEANAGLERLPTEVVARVLDGDPFAAAMDGFAGLHPTGLRLALPMRGEEPLRLELPDGFVLSIREEGCTGSARRAVAAVRYPCGTATSFWRQSGAGFEEWRLLPAGSARAESLVKWQVEGGRLVQHGRSVDVHDEQGIARLTVSAPAAYDTTGRAIGARLVASGDTLRVSLDESPARGPLLIDPAWVPAGSMAEARRNFTALSLPDGRVLVAGGDEDLNGTALSTAEFWDPATRTFSSAAPMISPRIQHTSTLLDAGSEVLVVAGNADVDPATAERYDIAADAWTEAGSLAVYRRRHAAALLPDGSVLVAGGESDDTAERYDPVSNTWSALPPVPCNGIGRPAVTLQDGRVLVNCGGEPEQPVFDPATMTWTSTGPMTRPRGTDGEKVALSSGRVLAVGGGSIPFAILATAELYDPVANTWSDAASMTVARHIHSAARLADGTVVVTGGRQGNFMYTATTERYDELTDAWTAEPFMSVSRYGHSSVAVAGGNELLVIGGAGNGGFHASAELLRPGDPNGTPCDEADDCATGFCADGVCCNRACDAGACEACSLAAGAFSDGFCRRLTGTACDDGDGCTQTDICSVGVCVGGDPVECVALDQCHMAGACDSATGACSNPARPDGTTCNDGDACTQADTCQTGTCTGEDAVVCAALDQCHVAGTCDPANGTCSNPAKPDGATCNDGDACTQTDTCMAGQCAGDDPIVCNELDQCHVAGTCDSATGVCSNPTRPDGTACDDDNACTQTDACATGTCVGADPILCIALDQCHVAGTCDPGSGVCSNPTEPDGAICSDGDACTRADACFAGSCVGDDPVVCAALDACHAPGSCDSATGLCSHPEQPDGIACDDGDACTHSDTCLTGACIGDPVVCTSVDTCHLAGTCDPGTGLCSSPVAPDGLACGTEGACEGGTCEEPDAASGVEPMMPRFGGGACTTSLGRPRAPHPTVAWLTLLALLATRTRRRWRSSLA